MFYKDNITLLAECAKEDLNANTLGTVTESRLMNEYSYIKEASEDIVYSAEMVPVLKIDNGFYTEMQFIAPYMSTNGIRKIAEALDNIADANGLPSKSVGLLIESETKIKDMINDAKKKSMKTGDNMLNKVKKGEEVVDKLKNDGYKVMKKKSNKIKKGVNDFKDDFDDGIDNIKNSPKKLKKKIDDAKDDFDDTVDDFKDKANKKVKSAKKKVDDMFD